MSDLAPLSGLSSLQTLDCSYTQVSDLAPLSGLSSLQTLDCRSTQVSDLSPLSGLASLQTLSCNSTPVSDLSPLSGLSSLQTLDCSYTPVSDLPEAIVWLKLLQRLCLFNTHIIDIPAEVLSQNTYSDCLGSLRAHFRDLEAGGERLPDVKALVLGNGRIGKTQICRRLRGEDFQPDADSTHGILVTTARLPIPDRTAAASPGRRPGCTSGISAARTSITAPTPSSCGRGRSSSSSGLTSRRTRASTSTAA